MFCPRRLCLQTRCPNRTSVCRPIAHSGTLSADPIPPLTSVCRPHGPTDLCLQTRCPRRPLYAEPMPPQTFVCRAYVLAESVCIPDANADLFLHSRCPHRPQSADPMPPQTSVCRPEAPPADLVLQTRCSQWNTVCRADGPSEHLSAELMPPQPLPADY